MNVHRIYGFVSTPFRRRRMREFETQFLAKPTGPVLDVGGAEGSWRLVASPPKVVLLNIGPRPDTLADEFEYVQGDGCALPFDDHSFEIVFSNSVIEHLSTRERQRAFANEIRRVGQSYYVQTPSKWFPIEPHYLTPGIHYLPKRWQVALLRNASVWGWMARPSREYCERMVSEVRLLDRTDMADLFPEATIRKEKVLGLDKSIVAIYRSPKTVNGESRENAFVRAAMPPSRNAQH